MVNTNWTHPSLTADDVGGDPVEFVVRKSRQVAVNAIEEGWDGPPFDPFELADILNICVEPNGYINDAMLVPVGNKFRIEYNPTRSQSRIRFSIAHEIAHTLFPDCKKEVRHRLANDEIRGDQWQLEMLCNIGAGELLMPFGHLELDTSTRVSIDDILDMRNKFGVSTEGCSFTFRPNFKKTVPRICCVETIT